MTLQALPTALETAFVYVWLLGLLLSPLFGWTLARALVWKDLTPRHQRGRMRA